MKQIKLLKDQTKAYGGELLKTRKGRSGPRPLSTRSTMHLVLRSSKASGAWSFWKAHNRLRIQQILERYARKYGIRLHSVANVGNHLHLQIKLSNRYAYTPFIRAVTASIAMAITGASRWRPLKKQPEDRFWDHRPFTRVVRGYNGFLKLRDYIQINRLEGFGFQRRQAKFFLAGAAFTDFSDLPAKLSRIDHNCI